MDPTLFCFTELKLFETLVKVNTKHVQPYDLGHSFFKEICSLASDELRASGGSTHTEVKEAGGAESRARDVPMTNDSGQTLALDNDMMYNGSYYILKQRRRGRYCILLHSMRQRGGPTPNTVSVVCRIKCPWKNVNVNDY